MAGREHLPPLQVTREHAARKIAARIRDFERLLNSTSTGNIRDLEDDAENKRQHTIELLHFLFGTPTPGTEFNRETTPSILYTNIPEEELRANLAENLRQCINHLRGVTARLDFYEPPSSPVTSENPAKTPLPIRAILLFTVVLIAIAGLVIWQGKNLATLPPAGAFFMYLLIALLAAILLFGLFRSNAKITGTFLGFPIEITGAAALFFTVLLLGLWWYTRTATSDLPATKPAVTTTSVAPAGNPGSTTRDKPTIETPTTTLLAKMQDFVGGESHIAAVRAMRAVGTRFYLSKGMTIEVEHIEQYPDRFREVLKSPDDSVTFVLTPTTFYAATSKGVDHPSDAVRDQARAMVNLALLNVLRNVNNPRYSFSLGGEQKVATINTQQLQITIDGTTVLWLVEPTTGRLLRQVRRMSQGGRSFEYDSDFTDWKTLGGVTIPMRTTEVVNGKPENVLVLSTVEINPAIDPKLFSKPEK